VIIHLRFSRKSREKDGVAEGVTDTEVIYEFASSPLKSEPVVVVLPVSSNLPNTGLDKSRHEDLASIFAFDSVTAIAVACAWEELEPLVEIIFVHGVVVHDISCNEDVLGRKAKKAERDFRGRDVQGRHG